MRTTLIMSFLILGTLIVGPAVAQQQDQRDQTKGKSQSQDSKTTDRQADHSMRSDSGFDHAFMDTDKDGRVSKKEFEKSFAKLDSNSDGFVSSDEWSKANSRTSDYRGTTSGRNTSSETTKPDSTRPDSPQKP